MKFRGEHFARGCNFERTKELIALAGWAIAFHSLRDAEELELRAERGIESARAERAGMRRSGDEFPKGSELAEFGCGRLDATFGPQLKFLGIPQGMKGNRPPSEGYQFFGTLAIAATSKTLTAKLHNVAGKELYSVDLEPA